MATASWELQKAVYAALTVTTGLGAAPGADVAAVYDEVPENAPRPYIVIGEIDELPDDAHDRQGYTTGLTIHVWSDYRGYAEVSQILEWVDAALDRKPLAVEGLQHVSCAAVSHQLMRDTDPNLRHGIARYRVWATDTATITT